MSATGAGTRRPGGRTARTRAAVLDALRSELAETDYEQITVERIAQRAGVAKTTVYRRWASVDRLVAELLSELAEALIPLPDTGTLDGDLLALAHGILAFHNDPTLRHVLEILVSAAVHDRELRDDLTAFFTTRTAHVAELAVRAIERGEIPADTDPVEVIRIMAAPVYYRMFITGEPIDAGVAARGAAIAAEAARAGLLTRGPDLEGVKSAGSL
ncbi:TetR/AcrR family transcriptional regulator [Actinomadura rudentiformis]|uniref:TetR/AcrR family transcriptional regulator n=1 Tax=Actinomadura rudentiformis TaxID=359158 RepID=A0A6H9Z7I5_9ACTN|nr:TetR/AcrR family transcriptional regulator [Actinomadura rudentiformis]KAB2352316.1 TetR/AcrR family transcriptional regulator [Actinomadura rudentiformis]